MKVVYNPLTHRLVVATLITSERHKKETHIMLMAVPVHIPDHLIEAGLELEFLADDCQVTRLDSIASYEDVCESTPPTDVPTTLLCDTGLANAIDQCLRTP